MKRNLWKIIMYSGFLVAAVAFGAWISSQNTREALGEAMPIQGKEHISVGSSHPLYSSNPPTSGWHYGKAAEWGIYNYELPDEQIVHNLEHGGIWISYKNINGEIKSKLEKIAYQYPKSVILTPRAKNDSEISLAAWGRLMKLETFDENLIKQFIKNYRNKSPEPLAR